MTDPITTPAQMREALDAALADYTPGIDCAVRFVTIDQVDMLAEFYLHNRALPVAERQAIRDNALDDAAQAASNRAAYFRDAAETASEAGFHALRAFHAMRELCLVEIAAAIRAMKGKPE